MLKEELKALNLQGDIYDSEETLIQHSHDASLFEVKPEIVIFPKGVEDIKKVVSFASAHKTSDPTVSVTARSAGTDMTGGPLNTSIILGFTKYFNTIQEIGTDYAIVEPGVYYRDFEKETLKHGIFLPPFPASREICAIGGLISNNSAGEKTLTHGKMEDYILQLDMVLADGNEYTFKALTPEELKQKLELKNFEGEIYKKIHKLLEDNYELIKASKPDVSKNSAGYYLWNVYDKKSGIFDLTKLLVGAQGTLGIATRVKLRLVPVTSHSKLLVIFLKDLKHLAEIVNIVLPYNPETFESYDDQTLKLAIKFLPDLIKILKPKNLLKLMFQFFPEFWMTLTGGMPKLVLMVEFAGDHEEEIDAKMQKLHEELKKFGAKSRALKTEEESKKYWVIRHESFNLLRHHVIGRRTAPFIDDVVVKPEYLPQFLPQLNSLLSEYNLIYTIAGHVGDGNFHIIPLMDLKDPAQREIIPELSQKVYNLVLAFHGSITAEHNDGLIRSPYLKQMYGEKMYALFEETKNIFDPQNIFNPGKKVNSSLEYAMKHIFKN